MTAYSRGSYSRSASCTITKSEVASAKPRRRAAPLPWFTGWRNDPHPRVDDTPVAISQRAVGGAVVDDDELAGVGRREHLLDDDLRPSGPR